MNRNPLVFGLSHRGAPPPDGALNRSAASAVDNDGENKDPTPGTGPMNRDDILIAKDIATELRCSKAQVYKIFDGKVGGCSRLPVIRLGRKKVVRRSSFEKWKQDNETMERSS